MKDVWAVPIIVSILILGSLGYGVIAFADVGTHTPPALLQDSDDLIFSYTVNVDTDTETHLVIFVGVKGGEGVGGATWNGNEVLSKVVESDGNDNSVTIFSLSNPTSGTHDIELTGVSGVVRVVAVVYDDVDTITNGVGDSSDFGNPSIEVPTMTGSLAIAMAFNEGTDMVANFILSVI